MFGWLNEAAVKYGGKQVRCALFVDGPTLTSLTRSTGYRNSTSLAFSGYGTTHALDSTNEANRYWQIALYGGLLQETIPTEDEEVLASLGLASVMDAEKGFEYGLVYDDNW